MEELGGLIQCQSIKTNQVGNPRYCWWFRNPANQLRLVGHPIIYDGFQKHPNGGFSQDFWTINSITCYNLIFSVQFSWLGPCWIPSYSWKWWIQKFLSATLSNWIFFGGSNRSQKKDWFYLRVTNWFLAGCLEKTLFPKTLTKTNISPENCWLEDDPFLFTDTHFSGRKVPENFTTPWAHMIFMASWDPCHDIIPTSLRGGGSDQLYLHFPGPFVGISRYLMSWFFSI